MCIGSNLGPTMAAYAMHMIETKYTIIQLFYLRYMDDICAVFNNKNEATTFFKHINSIHKNIKFTQEAEKNKKLVFLHTEIQKHDDTMCTKWHLNSTYTGRYLA